MTVRRPSNIALALMIVGAIAVDFVILYIAFNL